MSKLMPSRRFGLGRFEVHNTVKLDDITAKLHTQGLLGGDA